MNTVTYFQNAFDNAVIDECVLTYTWPELVEEFRNMLVISETKNSLGFVWAKYNTENPLSLAPVSNEDPTPRLNAATGKTMARRAAANLIEYYGLALDYDGGATLADVKEQLQGLRYLGYTSFRHVITGVDKFRILIPFATPCPHDSYRLRVNGFKALFPNTDDKTFDSSRIFYGPNVSAANRQHFQFWEAEGEPLDWTAIEETPPYEPPTHTTTADAYRAVGMAFSKDGTGQVDWKSFDILQFARDAGMDPRPAGGRKYNVICPRVHEHSGGVKSGTVIFDEPGDGHFYCSHGHGASWFFEHFANEFNTRGWKFPWCDKLVLQETK